MSIKRFDCQLSNHNTGIGAGRAQMTERMDGDYVLYTDHLAALEQDRIASDDLARKCLEAALQGAGWRPMETAPKDGTVVLGAVNGVALRVCWIEHYGAWYCQEIGEDREPYAWMPLPLPPKATPSSEEVN